MNLWESAWVIARRDFVASVFSRFFILFLLAPLILFGFMIFFSITTDAQDRAASQPVVAVVTDSATSQALNQARARLVAGTSEQSFPILRFVDPAEDVPAQAQTLLAGDAGIEELSVERRGLHDAFVAIAGESAAREMEANEAASLGDAA